MRKIAIIGGGIAGLTTAIALKKLGFDYRVYEAASKIEAVGAGLGLGANAILALKQLGIHEEIIKHGKVLSAFNIINHKEQLISHTDSVKLSQKYGLDNFAIHRYELHAQLLKLVGSENIECNKRVFDIQIKNNKAIISFIDGSKTEADFVIASDGIHSPVRKQLLPESEPVFAGYTCWRGTVNGGVENLDAAFEIWGPEGRIGIVPLANNQIYWFACVNTTPNHPEIIGYKSKHIVNHFKTYPTFAKRIIEKTKDHEIIWGDIYDLNPLPRFAFNNILLIGDAAHATTPNMGQGACQAIEDAAVLYNILKKEYDLHAAFALFEEKRLKRTKFIIERSRQIGKIAQLENKTAIYLRNLLLKNIPASVNQKQFDFLYNVNFN